MQNLILEYVVPGSVIGIAAALTPGPLMALIVSESIRGGFKSGAKIAITPLITDVPFIILAIILAKGISQSPLFLAGSSFLGAAFLFFLAWQNVKAKQQDFKIDTNYKGSLWKGVVVNILNPKMYLWWFSVATPFFARGNTVGSAMFAAALLLWSVFIMLGIAFGVTKVRLHIFDYAHLILRGLSVALFIFSLKLFQQGMMFF